MVDRARDRYQGLPGMPLFTLAGVRVGVHATALFGRIGSPPHSEQSRSSQASSPTGWVTPSWQGVMASTWRRSRCLLLGVATHISGRMTRPSTERRVAIAGPGIFVGLSALFGVASVAARLRGDQRSSWRPRRMTTIGDRSTEVLAARFEILVDQADHPISPDELPQSAFWPSCGRPNATRIAL